MRAIGPPLTAEESAAFLEALRSQVKRRTKFKHRRRDPRLGLDCAGLLLWAMRQIGRPVVDVDAYGREPYRNALERALTENLGAPIRKEEMRPGDVVMMKFAGDPRHVAVIGDYPGGLLSVIHTHDTLKHVAEHRIDDTRNVTIVSVWRP